MSIRPAVSPLEANHMTVTGSDKYGLAGDADLSETLARRVYGLFVSQPLTPDVGLEFWLCHCQ